MSLIALLFFLLETTSVRQLLPLFLQTRILTTTLLTPGVNSQSSFWTHREHLTDIITSSPWEHFLHLASRHHAVLVFLHFPGSPFSVSSAYPFSPPRTVALGDTLGSRSVLFSFRSILTPLSKVTYSHSLQAPMLSASYYSSELISYHSTRLSPPSQLASFCSCSRPGGLLLGSMKLLSLSCISLCHDSTVIFLARTSMAILPKAHSLTLPTFSLPPSHSLFPFLPPHFLLPSTLILSA